MAEFSTDLHLRRTERRNVLAEARDHLLTTVEALTADGGARQEAESEAVARFGPAADLARRFDEEAVTEQTRQGAFRLPALGAALFVLFVILTTVQPVEPWADGEGPMSLRLEMMTAQLAMQVALPAGLLTVARAVRKRHRPVVLADDRTLIRRGATISITSAGVGAVLLVVLAVHRLTYLEAALWQKAGTALLVVAMLGVVAIAERTLWSTAQFERELVRADRSTGHDGGADELSSVPPGRVGRLVDGSVAVIDHVLSLMADRAPGLDLRRHPWRVCAVFCVLVAVWSAFFNENAGVDRLVYPGIEVTAVVLGFWLLGPALALRSPHHPDSAHVPASRP